jgi:outer membrane protein assembly factor BamB
MTTSLRTGTFDSSRRWHRRLSAGAGLAVLATSFLLGGAQLADSAMAAPAATTQWLGYHGGANGAGAAVGISSVNTTSAKWTSPVLDGQVYAEPLVYAHEVIVATENNSVYALSSATGAVLWHKHLAPAVPSRELPCGDISPLVGITGTPVIDPVRHEVFALAFEIATGAPVHYMWGLNVNNGALMLRRALPTPTPDQLPYLNRSGLALSHGSIIYTFGGNYGDCETYHGVVGALKETGAKVHSFVVDSASGQSQGAVWMGGAAPAIDAAGNVWVTSGNGSVTSSGRPYDHSDGVLELTSTMHLKSFFAPSNWAQDNASDADLSAEPAVLSNGLVVATGKSGHIYLLRANHLGGVGGQISAIDSNCGDVLDGGFSLHGRILFLPCMSGTEAVRVTSSPAAIKVIWHASVGSGPPIMAAQLVWTIGSDGVLYGLNPDNGKVVQHAPLGSLANHFSTPSVGAGLLLAPISQRVVAFSAT